jgi:hypothetical protein
MIAFGELERTGEEVGGIPRRRTDTELVSFPDEGWFYLNGYLNTKTLERRKCTLHAQNSIPCPDMLSNIQRNLLFRLQTCFEIGGTHFEQ